MRDMGLRPPPTSDGEEPRKPSFRERQRQIREGEIVAAAGALLGSKGYAGMTLDDVANAVGISKPTLYQHFASKEELGARILLDGLQRAQDQLASLAAELPPREAVKAMIEWGIDTHFGKDNYADFTGALFLFSNPVVRQAERDMAAALAAVVERGQVEKTIPSIVPALMIAQTFSSILKDTSYEDDHRKGELSLNRLKEWTIGLLIGNEQRR